jgi:hypothetical protein
MGGSKVRRSATWGCACIVLMLSATVCLSYDAKGFVSFGVGNKSCDQYVSDAQQPDRGFVYETWLSGYLTAFNAYNQGVSDILVGTDFDGAVAWIKSYCREHPTAVVHIAAVKLIQFMQQKTDVTDSKPARLRRCEAKLKGRVTFVLLAASDRRCAATKCRLMGRERKLLRQA